MRKAARDPVSITVFAEVSSTLFALALVLLALTGSYAVAEKATLSDKSGSGMEADKKGTWRSSRPLGWKPSLLGWRPSLNFKVCKRRS